MRNNFAAMFEFHISKIQLFLYKLCPFVATLNHICLVNHVIVVECCKYTNLAKLASVRTRRIRAFTLSYHV